MLSLYVYLVGIREGYLFWGIPTAVYPPVFWLVIVLAIIQPFNIFYRELRFWLLSM